MKSLLKGVIPIILLTTTISAFSQQPPVRKSSHFKSAPERITASPTELEKAFTTKEGSEVTFRFRELQLKGTVLSSVKRYENLYSVIIKSQDSTLYSFSKRINNDKSVTYIGRILNDNSSDGYELKKGSDGTYTFHKIQTEDLIQDY